MAKGPKPTKQPKLKVVMLKTLDGVGDAGELVEVKRGHGRSRRRLRRRC